MPTTPLTDAIEALTRYANETTGASDTTLSDAVGTLAAGYGGGGGSSELLYNTGGKCFYLEDSILPSNFEPGTDRRALLKGAAYLKSVKWLYTGTFGGSNAKSLSNFFANCPLLESVHLARTNGISTSGYVEDVIANSPSIKSFIVGDIGYPNTIGMGSPSGQYMMFRNITATFDIIIYTSAADLASVPTVLKTGSPWGATNATVIYKSSVTGEILV